MDKQKKQDPAAECSMVETDSREEANTACGYGIDENEQYEASCLQSEDDCCCCC